MLRLVFVWFTFSALALGGARPVLRGTGVTKPSAEEEAFSRHVWDGKTTGCSSAFVQGAEGKVTLITAAHCNPSGKLYVDVGAGTMVQSRAEVTCKNHPEWRTGGHPAGSLQGKADSPPDVAVCEGRVEDFKGLGVKGLPCVNTAAVKAGDDFTIFGRGGGAGDPPALQKGDAKVLETKKPNTTEFYTEVDRARTVSGDSGGVVGRIVDGHFQIVGVTSGERTKDYDKDPVPEASVFANLAHVSTFLKDRGVKFCGDAKPQEKPSVPTDPHPDIADIARRLKALTERLAALLARMAEPETKFRPHAAGLGFSH